MGSENNDVPSQTLRRDRLENNLYFFYKQDKFAVLLGVHDEGYKNMLQFGGFDAKRIADFRGVGEDKFLIMEKTGVLTLFHFSAKFIKKLYTFDLNYEKDENLEFCAMNICDNDQFIVASAGNKLSQEKKKLMLMELDSTDYSIRMLDEKDFEREGSNSVFFKLSIDLIGGARTIVSCFEKGNDFNLICFAIQSGKFEHITTIPHYHKAPFLTMTKVKG
jgi:hypothetical protein